MIGVDICICHDRRRIRRIHRHICHRIRRCICHRICRCTHRHIRRRPGVSIELFFRVFICLELKI